LIGKSEDESQNCRID